MDRTTGLITSLFCVLQSCWSCLVRIPADTDQIVDPGQYGRQVNGGVGPAEHAGGVVHMGHAQQKCDAVGGGFYGEIALGVFTKGPR